MCLCIAEEGLEAIEVRGAIMDAGDLRASKGLKEFQLSVHLVRDMFM
jgi:hypothetical protein